MNLPIEATWGYTDLWLSKNKRYLFDCLEEQDKQCITQGCSENWIRERKRYLYQMNKPSFV